MKLYNIFEDITKKLPILLKKYPEFSEDDIKDLVQYDPTDGKYVEWIILMVRNGTAILPEDGYKITDSLKLFNNLSYKKYFSQKDIYKYQSLQDLDKEASKIASETQKAKELNIKNVMPSGAEIIYRDNEWTIFKLTSRYACEELTKDTRWCTARGAADGYLSKGPLYAVKKNGQWFMQIHLPTKQTMDVNDKHIKIPPELKQILEKLIHPLEFKIASDGLQSLSAEEQINVIESNIMTLDGVLHFYDEQKKITWKDTAKMPPEVSEYIKTKIPKYITAACRRLRKSTLTLVERVSRFISLFNMYFPYLTEDMIKIDEPILLYFSKYFGKDLNNQIDIHSLLTDNFIKFVDMANRINQSDFGALNPREQIDAINNNVISISSILAQIKHNNEIVTDDKVKEVIISKVPNEIKEICKKFRESKTESIKVLSQEIKTFDQEMRLYKNLLTKNNLKIDLPLLSFYALTHQVKIDDKIELENNIKNDAKLAYLYAIHNSERFIEAEPTLAKSKYAAYYAIKILQQRWPEAEDTIAKDPQMAYIYATSILKHKWKPAEEILKTHPTYSMFYNLLPNS